MKYQILTKLLEPNFLGALIFVDQRFCQHPSSTTTQLNLNLLSWARLESDIANHPTTETQCQQYLSFYWPDFDETLNIGSWEHRTSRTDIYWIQILNPILNPILKAKKGYHSLNLHTVALCVAVRHFYIEKDCLYCVLCCNNCNDNLYKSLL